MERSVSPKAISLGEIPWWSWLVLVLLLVVLFLALSASGDLLAPLIGKAAYATDYLHEFTHDGRHLLAIPCH
ncbi:MAG: CbtB-domain containing protein [Rubrobacter sp.]|nr:CbtB-domain containing protein [Rubrobacter sp.]